MATLSERLTENAAGTYYVDASCIDCDQCRVTAPDFFGRNPDTCLSFVVKQPSTPEEIELVEQAIASCATDSIGRDGA